VEEKKKVKEEHAVQCELAHWFSHAAPFLPWYTPQSQPDVQCKVMDPECPRFGRVIDSFCVFFCFFAFKI
jgi:hypothetical protein